MEILLDLLRSYDLKAPNFRPTEIFNENWLLKLILHQAAGIDDPGVPLGFLPGSTWYSEAMLPTPFTARSRSDPLWESRTNADGVIGNFSIGRLRKADFELNPATHQFTVVEAKVHSGLAKGVKNAPYFDQAARNVSCMAEVIARAGIQPAALERVSFIVVAPQAEIDKSKFDGFLKSESIRAKVKQRVSEYNGTRDTWFQDYFEPLMSVINLQCLNWEDVIQWIHRHNPGVGDELDAFYRKCILYN